MLPTSSTISAVFLMVLTTETTSIPCEQSHDDSLEELSNFTVHDKQTETILQAHKKCNPNCTQRYDADKAGYIPVDCGRCYIFQLNVWANRDTSDDPRECRGMTPELFSGRQDCMWKNYCILRYSPSPIAYSFPDQLSCVGEEPGSVDVGYSCLDSEIVIDDLIKGVQVVESARGLIRSHKYDVGRRVEYPREPVQHVLDITLPARLKNKRQSYYVMLYVVTSDISKGDVLIMCDSSFKEILTWQRGSQHNISTTTLHFEFLLGVTKENKMGFDICFQWFENDKANAATLFEKTVELCKSRTERINVFPHFDMIKDTITQEPKGIIRSHSLFPWNYPRPELKELNYTFYNWYSHVHVLLAPSAMTFLEIYVQNLDLGWGDHLSVSSHEKTDQELNKTSLHYFSGQNNVTLNFSVYQSTMFTGSGFMLCYQWHQTGKPSSQNVCDQFADIVHPCNEKAKRQVRKKCGLRRKKEGSNTKGNSKNQKDQKKTKLRRGDRS